MLKIGIQSRLTVVSHVAKKNAHAMTTESLFKCTKMYKKMENKANLPGAPIISLFLKYLHYLFNNICKQVDVFHYLKTRRLCVF